jgi:hypothetical protein
MTDDEPSKRRQSIDTMLGWRELASKIEAMEELADEYLNRPTTMEITRWEDGTAGIVVYHALGHGLKEVVHYHTGRPEVVAGVYDEEEWKLYHREEIAELGTIEPPGDWTLEDIGRPVKDPDESAILVDGPGQDEPIPLEHPGA